MSRLRFKAVTKPWYKKWWGVTLVVWGVLTAFFIVLVFNGGNVDKEKLTTQRAQDTTIEDQ